MSLDVDEEILQDFLVEAGEILELLSEQLVDLEHSPDDSDLLNAIFRGFHTVKGGAGFLQIAPLVDCCHIAENVFDKLRNHELQIHTHLMDVVLQTLDAVNEMFDSIRAGEEPDAADPQLLEALAAIARGETVASDAVSEPEAVEAPVPAEPEPKTPQGDKADAEFEEMLSSLGTEAEVKPPEDISVSTPEDNDSSAVGESDSDEITEDEFEALLDQLHGEGQHGGAAVVSASNAVVAAPESSAPSSSEADDDDLITDDEFDKLLDELQSQGKGAFSAGVEPTGSPAAPENTASEPAPAEPVPPKPVPTPAAPVANPAPAAKPAPAAAVAGQPNAGMKAAAAKKPRGPEKPNAAETTVRVDTQRLDEIMNMVGELVLVRNRMVRLGHKVGDEEVTKAVGNLDVVTADLQMSVMKTRMQPIKKVFGRFPRVVRDLARALKKEVNLELRGEDTDLDKNLVEALADPLVHLVRNAVDHGIESPEKREAAGKPRVGQVILAAEQEGDHILLSIDDDGAGMEADKLRGIAVAKGLLDEDSAERLTDTECFNLIFAPGFSTKTEISDVSGRGVGMDVVKTKITQLNGSLNIDSVPGRGSRIEIKVPLTLAIMPTLMVMLGDQAFALPLVNVNEIFHLDLTQTNVVDGQEVVVVREKALSLFHLKRWLVEDCAYEELPENGHVVIVTIGTKRVGFIVDQLVGQEEVVIKPLGKMLLGTPGMAGATITGDGRIALILDIPNMLKHYTTR
ncbi:chemotaxis protein CheA [Motiliproteus sp. MSK22-1]|uniref:chemotaxis protein CheA n=1 Tax=Motiliproteus sp. MSK22-1 TaxID=1897630 RepID=UPI0009788675|nr:chemotaxis protein CheA [Motiliproteus sp. MSK22-1]OMH30053.1 chemotaxis protein CheA [Motiliproteus sp. MSK22-1]